MTTAMMWFQWSECVYYDFHTSKFDKYCDALVKLSDSLNDDQAEYISIILDY